jgi:voltage-gated potassium channel
MIILSSQKHDVLSIKDLLRICDHTLVLLSLLLLGLLITHLFIPDFFSYLISPLYFFLWIAFILEFGLKFYLSHDRLGYLRREFFVVFIIIFPFLRPLQLFPLSRWGLLMFAEEVSDHFPAIRKYRILEILLISVELVILSADIFLLVERTPDTLFKNFADALWFSIVTVATVGYGDVFPKTPIGRMLAVLLIIFGVSVFGIVTASISSYLVERETRREREEEHEKINALAEEEHLIEKEVAQLLVKEGVIQQKIEEIHSRMHTS